MNSFNSDEPGHCYVKLNDDVLLKSDQHKDICYVALSVSNGFLKLFADSGHIDFFLIKISKADIIII